MDTTQMQASAEKLFKQFIAVNAYYQVNIPYNTQQVHIWNILNIYTTASYEQDTALTCRGQHSRHLADEFSRKFHKKFDQEAALLNCLTGLICM